MKPILKIALPLVFLITGSFAFAQPGLNVQNRINSKVQTRVQGKVINSAANKAATISQKAAGKAANTTQGAINKTTQKVVVPANGTIKVTKPKDVQKQKPTEAAGKVEVVVKTDDKVRRETSKPVANANRPGKKKH